MFFDAECMLAWRADGMDCAASKGREAPTYAFGNAIENGAISD
jgi:hypothetical protein